MKLLTSLTSPYGRKIRIVLAEKHLDFELVPVSNPNLELAKINPLGKVPALILDDGQVLYDSPVIAEHLDDTTPVGRLIPKDHRQRIRVKLLEALADGITDAAVLIMAERRRPTAQQSSEWITKQSIKIEQGLAALAAELTDGKWLMGTRFSLADIAAGCMLGYLDFRFPEIDWRTTHPPLALFLDRIKKEKNSFIETAPPGDA